MSGDPGAGACPTCGTGTTLGAPSGALRALSCGQCEGTFLPLPSADHIVGERLGHDFGALRRKAEEEVDRSSPPCPSCGSAMGPGRVNGYAVRVCAPCGGMWLEQGVLQDLEAGRAAAPVLTLPKPIGPAHPHATPPAMSPPPAIPALFDAPADPAPGPFGALGPRSQANLRSPVARARAAENSSEAVNLVLIAVVAFFVSAAAAYFMTDLIVPKSVPRPLRALTRG